MPASFEYTSSGHATHLPAFPALPLVPPMDPDHCRYCRGLAFSIALWDNGSEEGIVSVLEMLDRVEGVSMSTLTEWGALGIVRADMAQLLALLLVHAAVMNAGGGRCRMWDDGALDAGLGKLLDG